MGKTSKKGMEDLTSHGGKRPGAGAPRKDEEPLVAKTYRLKQATVDKIAELTPKYGTAVDVVEAAVKNLK